MRSEWSRGILKNRYRLVYVRELKTKGIRAFSFLLRAELSPSCIYASLILGRRLFVLRRSYGSRP